jgi:SEC-C motif-containing protein
MSDCPCGSGAPLADCCGPILADTPATTPEALLRSRYSAFVLGKLDHVERTHAPEIRDAFNRAEAERTVAEVEWLGLDVRHAREDGDRSSVEFAIRFKRDGQDLGQYEVADFRRIDGDWYYAGGKTSASHPPRHVVKTGRNDPCHCGSGKKFKKCCGV